ncbi:Scn11a [Symbiodinium pilosum]|uniref:Scn11a protein n=1 Tax=Symbiodinium pilosum TaxID=2952 RepID=A0A812V807_SYMPI|nr:Scn11a [Symbiodinium pilosum]
MLASYQLRYGWPDIQLSKAEFYQKKNADANRKKYAVSSATGELEMHTAEDDQPPHINWRSPKNVAQYFSRSSVFIYGIMFVILFNLISLGIEVDIAAREGSNNVPIHFDYMNLIVVFIFVVEITVNFIANGPWGFCCSGDKWWNFFDLIIVILSVVETVVSFMANAVPSSQVSPSHLRFMRPIRLARALRGVRVMRLFRYVGALRTLLLSIMSSIASLFWTIVLLVLLFYSFGVLVTQLVSDHCELQPLPMGNGTATSFACQGRGEESTPYFYMGPSRYWSSVIESMLTLFMAISGGIDWDDGLTALRDIPLAFAALIMYIIITVFTVVNVVTGVFCNTAIESAAADKDIAVMKQMRKQAAQVQVLKHVFNEINNQSTDTINMQDLKDAMSAHKLSSFFESMGISTGDVWTLFKVIDTDGSGTIDMDEFVSGCMRLHGPAKSLDIAKMEFEHEVTRDSIASLEKNVSDMQELLMAFLGKDGKNGHQISGTQLAELTFGAPAASQADHRTMSDAEAAKTPSRIGRTLLAASNGESKLAKKAEAITSFLKARSEEVNCIWARHAASASRNISSLGHFWKLADDEVGPACGWGSAAFAAKPGESAEAKAVSVPIQSSPFVFERLAAASKQVFELSGAQGSAAVATAAAAKAALAELFAAAYEADRPSDLARLKRSGMSHLLQWLFDLSFLRIALSASAAPGTGAYESLRELLTKAESVAFSDPVDRLLYQDVLKASVSNHVQGTKVLLAPFFLHNPLYGYLSQSGSSGALRSNSKPTISNENEGFELQTTFAAPLRPVLPRFPLLPVAMNVSATSDLDRLRLDPPARKAEPKAASSLMQQAGGLVGSGLGTLKFGAALFTGKPGVPGKSSEAINV